MSGPPKSEPERVPEPLEAIATRLGELRVMFGDRGTATMAAVQEDLRQALAARDRHDRPEALRLISRSMERLAELAGSLDPDAALAMHVLIEQFRAALARGCSADAQQVADSMREMSGARIIRKIR